VISLSLCIESMRTSSTNWSANSLTRKKGSLNSTIHAGRYCLQFLICISCISYSCVVLPPFQIIRRFDLSRYTAFAMHLDYTMSRYIVKAMYLEKQHCLIIWNKGSSLIVQC
jgi:hypothetical protein